MRFTVVIDFLIIGFACISIAVFTATKDDHKNKENVQIQSEPDPSN